MTREVGVEQTPDAIGEIRPGDVISSMRFGLRITGVAAEPRNGGWYTAEGGSLVRAGEPFTWLELAREFVPTLYEIVEGDHPDLGRVRVVHMADGWWEISHPPQYRRIWTEGEPPLILRNVVMLREGLPK